MNAIAYMNWGRWVADCPSAECTNALLVTPGQTQWECLYTTGPALYPRTEGCGTTEVLVWPEDVEGIQASLAGLPDSQQNWQPEEVA